MRFFRKEKNSFPAYSLSEYEPVIKSSICTGEQVACMQNRSTGKLHEILLIRTLEDLEAFCRAYSTAPETIRKIY